MEGHRRPREEHHLLQLPSCDPTLNGTNIKLYLFRSNFAIKSHCSVVLSYLINEQTCGMIIPSVQLQEHYRAVYQKRSLFKKIINFKYI